MQITIFGASGKVGSIAVQEALSENFRVVAFVHCKSNLKSSANLQIIYGDIYNRTDVENAVKGSSAVVSALGSWGTPKKDVLVAGMKNIIPAMQKYGVSRIVSLTGADVVVNGENSSMLRGVFIKLLAKKILHDGQKHIQLLADSNLEWTVVRSPVMNDSGAAARFAFTMTRPMPWATINRKSVARAMVELINNSSYNSQAPYIKRAK